MARMDDRCGSRSGRRYRVCLRCGRRFMSLSSANRVCRRCKGVRFGARAEAVVLDVEGLARLGVPDVEDLAGGDDIVEIPVRAV